LIEEQVAATTQVIWDVLAEHTAGWHETSAMLGEPGNTVLNRHNTSNGEAFRDLYRLEIGNQIILHSREITHTYLVSHTLVMPEKGQPLEARFQNAQVILPTNDERLTLVTCHPYGSLRNRLVVIARPAEQDSVSQASEE
jgi:LPXTG-site transpeptidase (sortase) family protein